jgi:hypothetical protein
MVQPSDLRSEGTIFARMLSIAPLCTQVHLCAESFAPTIPLALLCPCMSKYFTLIW